MSFQQSTINARLVYENTLKLIQDSNLNPATVKGTDSDLVLEQALSTTVSQYFFPVLSNDNGPSGTRFNTEIRLNQQDSFVVASWGVLLCPAGSATDTTFIPQTYPNPQLFTGGGVAAALGTIYNSIFQITVNNDVVFPVLHASRFFMVPQTQQSPTIAGVENGNPYSQVDMSSDGFVPIEPNLVVIGSKGYRIVLNLASSLGAVLANSRVRVHFRGKLVQNSTIIT